MQQAMPHATQHRPQLRHPAMRVAQRRKQKQTRPQLPFDPVTADLIALNVLDQAYTADGVPSMVRIGTTSGPYAKACTYGESEDSNYCHITRDDAVILLVSTSRLDAPDAIQFELALIARILRKATNAGIQCLDLKVSSPEMLKLMVNTQPNPYRCTTGQIQRCLRQFKSIIVRGDSPAPVSIAPAQDISNEPDTPLNQSLRALKATSWRKDEQGYLMMVRFGNSNRTIPAIANSDAGIRRSCCTYGGIIREKGEVIGLVMERAEDTDNVVAAELMSLARMLEEAAALGVEALEVRVDCKAVLGHVVLDRKGPCGEAAARVRALLGSFDSVMLTAVRRGFNKEADSLATSARDVYAPEPVEPPTPIVLTARQAARARPVIARPWWATSLRRIWTDIAWANPFALGIIIR